MSLWEILCKIAEVDGFNLQFDLTHKSIKYKSKYLAKDGEVIVNSVKVADEEYPICEDKVIEEKGNPYNIVQALYNTYINSRPSKVNRYSVFTAKKSDELTYEQLIYGKDREEARCKLEGFIVLTAIAGKWNWSDPKHWFWVGNDGLVIYKEWI